MLMHNSRQPTSNFTLDQQPCVTYRIHSEWCGGLDANGLLEGLGPWDVTGVVRTW